MLGCVMTPSSCRMSVTSLDGKTWMFLGVLETRIKEKKASKLAGSRFKAFGFLANYASHRNGRIWVLWNPCTVSVTAIRVQAQYLHCQITHHSYGSVCQVTFVYADNDPKLRLSLWAELRILSVSTRHWLLVGDFNVVRDASERISSSLPNLSDILDFNACLLDCGLEDLSGAGCDFTWTNNQEGQARVWSKLDRALISTDWLAAFPSSTALFLPSGISDHSPVVVTVFNSFKRTPRFSFLNCWIHDPQYHDLVTDAWSTMCLGTSMYKFFFRLKQVRGALRGLHRRSFSNIQSRITGARADLSSAAMSRYE
ncbi:hypothetical protein RND81_09G014300 [Saponaria officinalis]|uniref:Endonuclease/exonuclease/phosphatase domain-containing protein n=1 Tax=Saponaria officinalis TaxID=3572 RepID=A0AAW1IH81_SAPOF